MVLDYGSKMAAQRDDISSTASIKKKKHYRKTILCVTTVRTEQVTVAIGTATQLYPVRCGPDTDTDTEYFIIS